MMSSFRILSLGHKRPVTRTALFLALGIGLAACGGSAGHGTSPLTPEQNQPGSGGIGKTGSGSTGTGNDTSHGAGNGANHAGTGSGSRGNGTGSGPNTDSASMAPAVTGRAPPPVSSPAPATHFSPAALPNQDRTCPLPAPARAPHPPRRPAARSSATPSCPASTRSLPARQSRPYPIARVQTIWFPRRIPPSAAASCA